jgi:hypothetical protein
MTTDHEYRNGRWQPSVPLPMFYGPLVRCQCGRWFLQPHRGLHNRRYERHYRRRHLP